MHKATIRSAVHVAILTLSISPVIAAGDSGPGSRDPIEVRADAYRLFMQGNELALSGHLERAQEHFEQVLELDPEAAPVRSLLAKLCLKRGDLLCAETEALRAVDLAEDDAEGHEVLSELARVRYHRSGDRSQFERAVNHLRAAAAAEPDDAMLWVRLIRMLGGEGLYDEAESEARRAAAVPGVEPSRPWMALAHTLLSRGKHARAIELLEGLDLPGRSAVPLLRMLADLKAGAEDFAGQVEVLERLRALMPDDPEIVHRLGHALLRMEDAFAALEPLSAALEFRPSDPTIRRNVARALVKLGQGERALEQFALLPDVLLTPNTLRLWAQAAEQAGRYELAADKLELTVVALLGTDQEALVPTFKLRAAKNRLRAGQPRRALDLVEDFEGDITVLRVRIAALEQTGRADAAERLLAAARARDPGDVGLIAHEADRRAVGRGESAALEFLLDSHGSSDDRQAMVDGVTRHLAAWDRAPLAARFLDAVGLSDAPEPHELSLRAAVLNAAGRVGEAEAAFRRLLDLRPDDHYALNELGYLLASEGRSLDEAIVLLERAVALKPEASEYLDSLGWALHRSGRSAEALAFLRRAVQDASETEVGVIREHLGDVYLALGNRQRALAEWRAALTFGGSDPQQLRRKIEDLEPATGSR